MEGRVVKGRVLEGRVVARCGVTCRRVIRRGGCVVLQNYLHLLLLRRRSGSLNPRGQSKCLSIIV